MSGQFLNRVLSHLSVLQDLGQGDFRNVAKSFRRFRSVLWLGDCDK